MKRKIRLPESLAILSLVLAGHAGGASALAQEEGKSVGRGWPMAPQEGQPVVGAGTGKPFRGEEIAARNGAVPEGVTPLPIDIFTSKDFYKDRDLWTNPLYFRCNSPMGLESQWGGYGSEIIGDNPPASGAWGFCNRDYPAENIVSPYPFKTAQEHYEALLAETKAKGGPTDYTDKDLADWNGRYNDTSENWYWGRIIQTSTALSLLTPEYQKRAVQMHYHQANTNAPQWQSQYCWPEGFMRRWHEAAVRDHQLLVTKDIVQWIAGVADNFLTQIHIGRDFVQDGGTPRLGQDVPRWYGETIGFWDGEALISWTSNIKGWTVHAGFEYSDKLQTIEIYTPNRNAEGKLTSIRHEAILYDPEAFVQPIRMVRDMEKLGELSEVEPYVFIECIQTIYPVAGRPVQMTPGTTIEFTVPDMYGRPWAQMWEHYFEQHMERPEGEGLFGFQ